MYGWRIKSDCTKYIYLYISPKCVADEKEHAEICRKIADMERYSGGFQKVQIDDMRKVAVLLSAR